MPGAVRVDLDSITSHSDGESSHSSAFSSGSTNVLVNGKGAVRVGDTTICGDIAATGSSNVLINGQGAMRVGDATTGHGDFAPSTAASGSTNVNIN